LFNNINQLTQSEDPPMNRFKVVSMSYHVPAILCSLTTENGGNIWSGSQQRAVHKPSVPF